MLIDVIILVLNNRLRVEPAEDGVRRRAGLGNTDKHESKQLISLELNVDELQMLKVVQIFEADSLSAAENSPSPRGGDEHGRLCQNNRRIVHT